MIPPPLILDIPRSISPGPSSVDALLASYFPTRPRSRSVVSMDQAMFPSDNIWNVNDDFTEQPPPADDRRIDVGTFIAFKLDRETIAAHVPPDSECHDEIRNARFATYLGLVTNYYPPKPGEEDSCAVVEVSYVSTSSPEERGAENLYVPIAPTAWRNDDNDSDNDNDNEEEDEYRHRKPLQTVPLFPFRHLVVWTTFGTRIKVSTFHDSPLGFQLPPDGEELIRFYTESEDDLEDLATAVPDSANPLWRRRAMLPLGDFAIPAEVFRDIRFVEPVSHPELFAEEWECVYG